MRSQFLAVALTTTCLTAAPVYADITPEEVWQSYQEQMSSMGMAPSAEVSREGDTLVVRNMVYAMELGTNTFSSTSTAPEIRFQERPGGTVAIRFAAPVETIVHMPVDPAISDEMIETRSRATYDGEAIASGTAEDQLYTFDNFNMIMESDGLIVDDMMIQPGVTTTLSGIAGSYSVKRTDDALSSDFDVTAAALVYDIEPFENADSTAEIAFETNGIHATGTLDIGRADSENTLATFLQNSDLDLKVTAADSRFSMKVSGDDPMTALDVGGTTGASTLDASTHGGAIGYDASVTDLDISVAGAQIPGGAVTISLAEYSAGILFPLAAAEDAQPFKLSIGLTDLNLPDIAWMIADPAGQLSHDPATLRIALEGLLKSDVDLFDFDALAALEEDDADMPFDVTTLELSDIYLALAGASVEGAGAGHFLDREPEIPGGMPPFAGTLSLKLTGVTALIDKLSASGIVPPEQSMMAQMMLGLLARPGDTPEELISEIEMTEDGSILANGQPLPF